MIYLPLLSHWKISVYTYCSFLKFNCLTQYVSYLTETSIHTACVCAPEASRSHITHPTYCWYVHVLNWDVSWAQRNFRLQQMNVKTAFWCQTNKYHSAQWCFTMCLSYTYLHMWTARSNRQPCYQWMTRCTSWATAFFCYSFAECGYMNRVLRCTCWL